MRVEHLGNESEQAEVAILAGVHGDEPCGVRAVEALLADPPVVDQPVKLVVANEEALARGSRYVEEDLNRAFPGDPDADSHEKRLADDLQCELRGCSILALHATQSHDQPFAVVSGQDELVRSTCPRLSVEAVVDVGENVEGRLFAVADVIEIECGLQGTDQAAANATRIVREFLAATEVLPDVPDCSPVPVYRLSRPLPKEPASTYEVFVENFQPVGTGETYAAADGRGVVADEEFVPVLVSPEGYETQFGYAAEKIGMLGIE